MTVFAQCLSFIFLHEGGYSNDPNDPGGETNFGIAAAWQPGLDTSKLTRDQAASIYKREFWDLLRCDELPPAVACAVFNFGVQHGPIDAAMALQSVVGARPDGIVGPETVRMANAREALPTARDVIARSVIDQSKSRNWEKYRYGWTRRNLDCYALCNRLAQGGNDG